MLPMCAEFSCHNATKCVLLDQHAQHAVGMKREGELTITEDFPSHQTLFDDDVQRGRM
jgi:hypothetical protein